MYLEKLLGFFDHVSFLRTEQKLFRCVLQFEGMWKVLKLLKIPRYCVRFFEMISGLRWLPLILWQAADPWALLSLCTSQGPRVVLMVPSITDFFLNEFVIIK